MNEDVKKCVTMRTDFFDQYFTVPDSMKNDVSKFIAETEALGENCPDSTVFEAQFASTGLSDRFNALIGKCVPKTVKMTKEQKQTSKEVMKDMLYENRRDIAEDALKDAAEDVMDNIHDSNIQDYHDRMIEDGTMADHTILKNHVEDAFGVFNFLKGKVKSKK